MLVERFRLPRWMLPAAGSVAVIAVLARPLASPRAATAQAELVEGFSLLNEQSGREDEISLPDALVCHQVA